MYYIDMHSHILSGVDDGAKNPDTTAQMLKIAYDDGIRGIICTPHYLPGVYNTGQEERALRVKHLLGVTKKFFPDLQLWEGCEYFAAAGSFMNDYEKGGCGTMAGSNYVLAEFSQTTPADLMELRLRDITKAGFWAIIAHAERYDALKDDDFRLRVAGFCYIQINADSLVGEATNHSKELARKMLAEGSVSFVATDAHGAHYRKPILSEAAKYITEHFGEEYTETLLYHNPKAILDDVRI